MIFGYWTGTGSTWSGEMHSGGVDDRGQMVWHFGPLSMCWCAKPVSRCNHVCSEHPDRIPKPRITAALEALQWLEES